MANDRYRHDQDRYRDRDTAERDWRDRNESFERGRSVSGNNRSRDDDGYIARRGFGNESAGYDRNRDEGRYDVGRERDYGDSAGYGTGGSTRDWRDVVGDDRRRGETSYGTGRGRDFGRSDYGSSYGRGDDRSSTGYFGRGSRDYNEDRGFFERAGDEIRSWFGDDDADRRRERDMPSGEHHRGRGPKGYQRSDERIREDVNDRLTDDPHIDASEIEIMVSTREVTLNGTVKSRFEKRHAEDLAESISGVNHVQNNLRIQQHAGAGISGSMLPGSGSDTGSGMTGSTTSTSDQSMPGMGNTDSSRRRTTSSSNT
jgi:osmotically-inducible protein OsmY